MRGAFEINSQLSLISSNSQISYVICDFFLCPISLQEKLHSPQTRHNQFNLDRIISVLGSLSQFRPNHLQFDKIILIPIELSTFRPKNIFFKESSEILLILFDLDNIISTLSSSFLFQLNRMEIDDIRSISTGSSKCLDQIISTSARSKSSQCRLKSLNLDRINSISTESHQIRPIHLSIERIP